MKTKWIVVALGVSLVLNIAAVGYLLGSASGGASKWRGPGLDPTMGIGRLLRMVPEERRAESVARETRRDIRASLVEVRRAQRAIDAALAKEPFDSEQLSAALAQFRERFAASQAHSHAALVDIAAGLTPQERQRFLKAVRRKGREAGPRLPRRDA